MADYFSPTIIQQPIPIIDMTPLERLVLSHIFDAEQDGETLYLHSALGPREMIELPVKQLKAAYEASAAIDCTATSHVAELLASAPPHDSEIEIEIDFSVTSWESILHDIVRRSSTLRYLTAVTSFTCSKMRPDGFGGMAVLITADAIKGKSTNDILEDFLADQENGAGGDGHVLFRLREAASART